MCIERIHRTMMAAMLILAATLLLNSIAFGMAILWFMAGMLALFAVTNFGPSVWMMSKAGLKPCRF